MASPVFIFAGPSLHGTPLEDVHERGPADGPSWLLPARRGDVDALVARHAEPGVIALADGTFHSYPSVGHRELRQAMQAGWLVYGLCSMGAIRVSELAHMGMVPWGRVARLFCTQPELADDEVALVHDSEPPFTALSEPMVHIREYLRCMREQSLLDDEQHDRLVHSFRERWYGERTLPNLQDELTALPAAQALVAELQSFERFRLKQQDLMSFATSRPWRYAAPKS